MNYAFLGRMIPPQKEEDVAKNSINNMQDAANTLQWHLYDGLCANLKNGIRVINFLPIGSYPQYYKKPFVKNEVFSTSYSNENLNVGFCNVKLIRNYFQRVNAQKELLKWCGENEENRMLFLYTLYTPFLVAIENVKKVYPDLRVCAIVADLPDMASLSSNDNFLQKKIRNKASTSIYAKIKIVDAFVLLTKQMADYMKITQPYCVVEGIATKQKNVPNFIPNSDEKKKILYTGTLHKRFGVMNLVEAFCALEGNMYELVLCGVGDSESDIKKAAKKDERIKFLGQKPRSEILEIQKEAAVLVNPRQNIEEFTKYSFPSKNLEYLSSGRPLVAYKLDGIPDEYDNYIYYVEDNSIEALTNKLREVCNIPSEKIAEFCKNAYDFVQLKKNEIEQTRIILDMLEKENIL